MRRLTMAGLHFVGGVTGLALQVTASGGRTWILRISIGGRRRDMGLGSYPSVTLSAARDRARAARAQISAGIDPIAQRSDQRAAAAAQRMATRTFEECAKAYIETHEAGWKNEKHGQQWRNTLATYAHPTMGALRVKDVGLPHILAILEPIWTTKTETATRLRGRIELVLDWATARGYRDGPNPARWRGHPDKLLPPPAKVAKRSHHGAVPVAQAGSFMSRLRAARGIGARALE